MLAPLLALDGVTYALALCPDCLTAREARLNVFGDHFVARLATLLLPLVLMALVAALFSWLERAPRPAPRDEVGP